MTRIVHLTSVHAPTDTRILHRECMSLAKAGYEVLLVVADAGKGMPVSVDGVEVIAIPGSHNRAGRMSDTARRIIQTGISLDGDLFHLHDPELLLWAPLLRMRDKPVIFDMHEYLPGAIRDKPWIPKPLRMITSVSTHWMERLLLEGLPVIFAEDSYHKHYPWVRNWTTVRNFPDVERISGYRSTPDDTFTIGYLGGVSEPRGSIKMLEALHVLQSQELPVACNMIGPASTAHIRQLEHLVEMWGLKNVSFWGRLSQPEALPIIARCHVGLAVLQDRPNYRESYPTKMFEYMALGIPVIVSDFPLYRSVIESETCGLYVLPDSPEEIANAIRLLHDQPSVALQMGFNGFAAIQNKYNWHNEATKMLSLYDRLLSIRALTPQTTVRKRDV